MLCCTVSTSYPQRLQYNHTNSCASHMWKFSQCAMSFSTVPFNRLASVFSCMWCKPLLLSLGAKKRHPTAAQVHYILCSSLLDQNYFHMARENELITLYVVHMPCINQEYSINTNKCTTVFWCSLIRQIYSSQLNHTYIWLLSFAVDVRCLTSGQSGQPYCLHCDYSTWLGCHQLVLSFQCMLSHYSINILTKIFYISVLTVITGWWFTTCTFYAHHPLNHRTLYNNF
jgi:hypothetical protein